MPTGPRTGGTGPLQALTLAALVAAACATGKTPPAVTATAPAPAPAGAEVLVSDRLFFGRTIPTGGQVSDSAWADFLAAVVTPRFPAGLTVWRAEGQWLDPRGTLVREPVMVIEIVHPPASPADSVFEGIAAEYRRRFHQDAVLRVRSPAHAWLYAAPRP